MKYTLKQTTLMHILPAAVMLLYGLTVLLYSFEYWIAGCFSILMGLLYALYLAVWKLEFDTGTGEFCYRALFMKEQRFHVDEIREFYKGGSHNPLFILHVRRMKIHIPEKLAEPLRQYLESRKKW